jgi:DNA-binding MarR family transcriptional regulator
MEQEAIINSIGYLIASICKTHRNKAGELLSSIDLYVGQEMFLVQLWQEDGLTLSEMADNLCVRPATVTRMLERMERAGLVERRKDFEDQRVSRIFLTQSGRTLHEPVHHLWAELERITMANFTFEERVLLRRLLLQVVQNLGEEV